MTARQAAPTTRQRQREQTRGQIIEAAAKVFARAGFEAASLSEIAHEAGVKKALVQYHYATKDQLWRSAARHLWQARDAHLAQFISDSEAQDSLDKMAEAFTALIQFTRHNPQWLWFMFHEAAANGERLRWLAKNCLEQDYRLGETFIREFQEQGLVRQGSPLHLLHLISGALTYNLLVAPATEQVTGVDLGSEESIARQVTLLQELLTPQKN